MSGHSKWSQIKHKKALTDAKKGKVFSKLVRQIAIAARQKGVDPEANPNLRMLIEKARSFNMPQDNIERAIKKGAGELEGQKFEEFTLEAYGAGNTAIIIEGTTDNKNRTVSEIKFLLTQHNGKLANSGSVMWLFERCGAINIKKPAAATKEDLELTAIDSGAQDFKWLDEENLEIVTQPEELEKVKKALAEKGLAADESSLDWRPKNEVTAPDEKTKEQLEKLFDALDENDDVSEIYSNLKT
ncbi:YebC/PmpR family DNA-binding transcriptional regulator [Patescibacteria group bacterium]|nr:YebC/PmpR family DNA-binding transcriptional regulator [Patescibacteria group bacterium]